MEKKKVKMEFMKIQNLCSSEDSVKKIKRQAPDSDKRFISKIYKEILQINNKKTNNLI